MGRWSGGGIYTTREMIWDAFFFVCGGGGGDDVDVAVIKRFFLRNSGNEKKFLCLDGFYV